MASEVSGSSPFFGEFFIPLSSLLGRMGKVELFVLGELHHPHPWDEKTKLSPHLNLIPKHITIYPALLIFLRLARLE